MSVFKASGHLLTIGFCLLFSTTSAPAGVFDNYSGTWRGTGKVIFKSGKRETVVCKIRSVVEINGTRAYHKVKCKSDSKKINVRISLSAGNAIIIGNWSASGAVEGSVYGKVDGRSLKLQLSGRGISAFLYLATSRCRQKMSLTGKIGKIRKISVLLKKDC